MSFHQISRVVPKSYWVTLNLPHVEQDFCLVRQKLAQIDDHSKKHSCWSANDDFVTQRQNSLSVKGAGFNFGFNCISFTRDQNAYCVKRIAALNVKLPFFDPSKMLGIYYLYILAILNLQIRVMKDEQLNTAQAC